MKTTIDLPAALVRRLKLRALRDRRKLKDLAAELLQVGLAPSRPEADRGPKPPIIRKDKKTGLPVIQCRRAASPGRELTPERISELLGADQDAWTEA